MTLKSIRRIFLALLLLLLLLFGLWLVVANHQQTSPLNLLFVEIPPTNVGIIVLASFVCGCVAGLLAALAIFRVLPLRWELRKTASILKNCAS